MLKSRLFCYFLPSFISYPGIFSIGEPFHNVLLCAVLLIKCKLFNIPLGVLLILHVNICINCLIILPVIVFNTLNE